MTFGRKPRILNVGLVGPWRGDLANHRVRVFWLIDSQEPTARFDLLLVTFEGELPAEWAAALQRALTAGTRVRHVGEYVESERQRLTRTRFTSSDGERARSRVNRQRKAALERVVIIVSLPVSLLIGMAIAAAILLLMGRPILFRQTRVGRDGIGFEMAKFRTMINPTVGGQVTLIDDPRVTPLGRLLRRYHADELPQLMNVMMGHMSLVGPRPEQPGLTKSYTLLAPAFAFRVLVPPGMTGLAQIQSGYASDFLETELKLEHDLYYIKNQSILFDAIILARTALFLICGNEGR